jgi:hypothetical protein
LEFRPYTLYYFFEHLGNDDEEQQWANYRLNETPSKGVMMWGILTNDYNNLTRATVVIFQEWLHLVEVLHTLMGYAESHDEERLMYNNLQSGNSSASTHDVKTLSVALSENVCSRCCFFIGSWAKMINLANWDGKVNFSCNGSVNTSSDGIAGDCKLDTKPQPQWTSNWLGDSNRNKIYTDWSKMITMKTTEPVFLGTASISNTSTLLPNIKFANNAINSIKEMF